MKKLLFNLRALMLLLLMMVGVSSVWAEEVTSTFTSNQWAVGNGEPTWTKTGANATSFESASPSRGVQTTLTSIKSSGLTLTNTTIKNLGNITEVELVVSANGTGGSISSVKVGNTTFTQGRSNSETYSVGNSNNQTVTFTGTATSGDIVIAFASTATSKSLYVKSIKISYTPSGKTALGTPTNLSSSVSNVTVNLSWDIVANANSYKVKIGENEYDARTNSYRAEGLDENTEYSWSVKALAGNSDSYSDGEYSNESSFTTGAFIPVAGTYNIVPNNTFFNCSAFTNKPSNFSNATGSKYGVTIKYNAASNAYINTDQCRAYSGTKLDFTAPAGFVLTKIVFTADGNNWAGTHTASVGTMSSDSKTWDGSASEVAITFGGTCRIKEIAVTYTANKVLRSVAVSGTPTKTTYVAGENFEPAGLTVTGTYDQGDPEVITEGITWSTPAALTAGQTSVDITATVNGITSSSYTVNGLTVNAPVTLQSISVTGTPADFWKGDVFNHNGITVTATWSDESKTDVTSGCEFSGYDMSAAGQQTVTVTYQGKTDTYDIEVKTIANTQETAYTVAEAKALIDAGKDLSTQVYVKGTVSEIVIEYSEQYGNISFNVSADGTTSGDQFQFYRNFKGADNNKWTPETEVPTVGDDVIGFGNITKYGDNTYEFSAGNYLVAHIKSATLSIAGITVADGDAIAPVITTNVKGEYTISYTSDNEEVVLAADDELVTMGAGTATITAILTADGYKTTETTFNVTVTTSATVTSVTLSGELTNTTYTIGDAFDHTGLVATANYSDGSQANVTETATWEVDPETLTTAGTVTVTVSASFDGQEDIQEYKVTVNKKVASISFAPATIEVEVNKSATISATVTPNDAELSYTITEGSEFISLEDGNITGVAEGTATVRADFEGNDEYAATSASLTVKVIPEDTRTVVTKNNFQAGETSGKIDASISYESSKGKSSTDPAVYSNCIRLYQNGGYITITAGSPASLSEVSITTGSTYESTTIGYAIDVIDDEDAPTEGTVVAKDTKYTVSGLDCSSISFYCLGTDKNSRLDIAKIEVKYNGVAAPKLDHITLSGTYPTEFNVGDVFSYEGMVVTAHYTDGSEKDVTDDATFSGFDSSSAGAKTIEVSYTEGDVTKTASYDVTVSVVKQSEIEETIDFCSVYSTLDINGNEIVADVVGASYDITFAKPQSSNTPTKFYQSGNAVRTYKNNTITISAIDPIVKVEIAYVIEYLDNSVAVSTGTASYDDNNVLNWWINDGETKSATLTAGSTSRFTSITVYYQCESRELAASGYTTIAAPFKCRIEGATAYIASSQNGEAVSLSAIEQSKVVDAGTGLMLKGTPGSNAYLVQTTKVAGDLGENLLVGVASADHVMASGSNYVLATKNATGVTAFYKYTGAAAALVGKAYLNVPSSEASSLRITFDDFDQDNETEISSIEEKEVDAPSFDLLGRKSNASGLLINNGKIIMVKKL